MMAEGPLAAGVLYHVKYFGNFIYIIWHVIAKLIEITSSSHGNTNWEGPCGWVVLPFFG
jgi:hypothetical protein